MHNADELFAPTRAAFLVLRSVDEFVIKYQM